MRCQLTNMLRVYRKRNKVSISSVIFSERERVSSRSRSLKCYMSSSFRLPVSLSSVTFVHPTQAIEIFSNVSMPFGTLAIPDLSIKILQRSSQGNPSVGV